MASLSKGYTFGATEVVTNSKLHNLVDLASISGISNADIASNANIDSTKINLASAGYMSSGQDYTVTGSWGFNTIDINGGTIDGATINSSSIGLTTPANGAFLNLSCASTPTFPAASLSGSWFKTLASTPSGAGIIPVANLPVGTTANKIVQLDSSAKLPALDGSQLTGISSGWEYVTGGAITDLDDSPKLTVTHTFADGYIYNLWMTISYGTGGDQDVLMDMNSTQKIIVEAADFYSSTNAQAVLDILIHYTSLSGYTNMAIRGFSKMYNGGSSNIQTLANNVFITSQMTSFALYTSQSNAFINGRYFLYRTKQ